MAYNASIGNRAAEKSINLTIDYSTIFNTNDITELRKYMGFYCNIIEYCKSLNDNQIGKIKSIKDFSNFSDDELAEFTNKQSEIYRNMLKPNYEIINYNIATDKSISVHLINNKRYDQNGDKINENITYRLTKEDNYDLSNRLDRLIERLTKSINDKKHSTVSALKKELEILSQIEQKEKAKK